jgi:hypothetical protein
MKVRDAIRASTAAPTYFAPAEIEIINAKRQKEVVVAVDGGLVANNPAYVAYIELREFAMRHLPRPPSRYVILTIGTGRDDSARSQERARMATVHDWMMQPDGDLFLLDQLFHAQTELTDYFLESAAPDLIHLRIDFTLCREWKDLATKEGIEPLRCKAKRIMDNTPEADDKAEREAADVVNFFCKLLQRAS